MLSIYEVIERAIKRTSDMNGNFLGASFELSDGNYLIKDDFTVTKDGEPLPVHGCKGGIYPEIVISGYPMKMYVLALIATDPMFVSEYLKGVVVNHCVITQCERELSVGQFGSKKKYHTAPNREVWFNPKYLELITSSENTKHARFVRDYGLYDTYVSAKDIDNLRPMMFSLSGITDETLIEEIKETNRALVESYYRGRGVTKKILF